jgi:hypothetical protein
VKKGLFVSLVALVLVGGTAIGGYLYWKRTPEFALKQVAKAITTHDRELFETYVDTESVINRAIDDLLAHENAQRTIDDGEKSLGEQIGEGLVQLMRPKIVEMVQRELNKAIEPTGPAEDVESPVTQLLKSAELKETSRAGKLTTVTMDATIVRFDLPVEVSLTMREQDGHQRIFAITNLQEILEVYDDAEEQWKLKENKRERDRISRALLMTGSSFTREEDKWGINKTFNLHLQLVNTTDSSEIVSWSGTLYFTDYRTTEILEELSLSANHEGFHPLVEQGMQWELDINQFIEKDVRLWKLGRVNTSLIVNEIQFANGQSLRAPYPEMPQLESPAIVEVLNRACGIHLRRVTPNANIIGAMAYPYDSAKNGDEYEIVSELIAGAPGSVPVRIPLRCWGLMENDGSITLREVRFEDSVIIPRTDEAPASDATPAE